MRYLIIASLIALVGAGCETRSESEYLTNKTKAIDACIAQKGVPVLDNYTGTLNDCKKL